MTLKAASVQTQMAADLIQTVLGQSQQAQVDLSMRMARIAMAANLSAPPSTAGASGAGGYVDIVG